MSYGGMNREEQQKIKEEVDRSRQSKQRQPEANKVAYKAFCEAVSRLDNIIGHEKDFSQLYGPKGMKIVKDAYEIVKAQSEEIFRDRKNPPTKEEQEVIHRALNILQDVLLTRPIVPFIRDLSIDFARLTTNWDRAICKCQPIRRKCLVIDQLARAQLSLITAIEVMQELVNRGQRHLQYTPPAFEISRAYMELDKE